MKFQIATVAGLLMAGQAIAAPAPSAPLQTRDGKTAAQIVAEIAPDSKTCASSTECRTADQAGPLLADAMVKYGVYSAGQIAGIIALTAFESVNYKYSHNVSPGRPGQGTSNMQMFNYNLMYAQSISALKGKVSGVDANAADAKKNEVLALVNTDEYNFGSGPWFFTTQCTKDVQSALAKGDDAGFSAYMGCVGVSVTDERKAYWTRAKAAFGLA
ncbi:uncharacterized protein GGS22DRAFT_184995 [Annulohypoxylon maeteangense]|uniref:uncharacterized protein n=1 Tax=Annulohypoxylon maeteangense TaxID=1927788 RepID=UPI0020079112|nr:uncharacterized protein GGS22DRAFT_184995 [Annulohypoxylon maeteangense]KAI0889418.1 hypothetical protein GGS22DRAFT_184995 [Annulohypoxylon maeteangense]